MIFGNKILDFSWYELCTLVRVYELGILDMETWIRYTWYVYMDFIYVMDCDIYVFMRKNK